MVENFVVVGFFDFLFQVKVKVFKVLFVIYNIFFGICGYEYFFLNGLGGWKVVLIVVLLVFSGLAIEKEYLVFCFFGFGEGVISGGCFRFWSCG